MLLSPTVFAVTDLETIRKHKKEKRTGEVDVVPCLVEENCSRSHGKVVNKDTAVKKTVNGQTVE